MRMLWWLLLMPSFALAFSKDFKLINDRAPLEFKLMFESMKNGLRDPVEQNRLVAYCGRINRGLAPLRKDQVMFLLKSEIYRTVLDWKFTDDRFQITESALNRLRMNLISGKDIYSPFSLWILEALLADSEKIKTVPTGPEAEMTSRYVRKWLAQAEALSAADFNALTLQVSWKILERVRERALLVQTVASESVQDTEEQTFNIPQLNESPPTPQAPAASAPSVSEQADRARDEAEKSLGKIDVKPSDIPATDMSEAIDKLEQEMKTNPADAGSGAQSPLQ